MTFSTSVTGGDASGASLRTAYESLPQSATTAASPCGDTAALAASGKPSSTCAFASPPPFVSTTPSRSVPSNALLSTNSTRRPSGLCARATMMAWSSPNRSTLAVTFGAGPRPSRMIWWPAGAPAVSREKSTASDGESSATPPHAFFVAMSFPRSFGAPSQPIENA
ncbi:MAG: hypothetical protein IT374_20640 [Polyangiaceae bacterium]|nr:hypothetical protein [Polyangiaceae bacterium]